jgi:hypothetical protein
MQLGKSSSSPSPYSLAAVQMWFARLYGKLGFAGASSHSGRRTFITQAARKISAAVSATCRSLPATQASQRLSAIAAFRKVHEAVRVPSTR